MSTDEGRVYHLWSFAIDGYERTPLHSLAVRKHTFPLRPALEHAARSLLHTDHLFHSSSTVLTMMRFSVRPPITCSLTTCHKYTGRMTGTCIMERQLDRRLLSLMLLSTQISVSVHIVWWGLTYMFHSLHPPDITNLPPLFDVDTNGTEQSTRGSVVLCSCTARFNCSRGKGRISVPHDMHRCLRVRWQLEVPSLLAFAPCGPIAAGVWSDQMILWKSAVKSVRELCFMLKEWLVPSR